MRQAYLYAAGSLFTMMCGMALNVLVGRFLGPDQYGIYALSRTAAQFFLMIAPLGMELGLQRFMSVAVQENRSPAQLLRFARTAAFAVFLVTVLVLLMGGAAALEDAYRAPGLAMALVVTLLSAPFLIDAMLIFSLGRVIGDMRPYMLWILFFQPLLRLALTAAVLVLDGDVQAVLTAAIFAGALTWLGYAMSENRIAGGADTRPPQERRTELRQFFQTSLWLGVSIFFYGLMRSSDTLVLGLFVSVGDVGRYAAMSFVAQTVQSLTLAVSQGLGAKVAAAAAAGDRMGLKDLIDEASLRAIPVSLFLFGGIAVFGQDLHVIFGEGFTVSAVTASSLAFGYLAGGVLGIVGYALSMAHHHKLESALTAGGGGVLLVAVFIGASTGGAEGVAVATCLSLCFVNIIRLVAVRSVHGYWPRAPLYLIGAVPAWLVAAAMRQAALEFDLPPIGAFFLGTIAYSLFMTVILIGGKMIGRRQQGMHRSAAKPARVTILSFHFAEYSARLCLALGDDHPVQMSVDRDKLVREAPSSVVGSVQRLENIVWYERRSTFGKFLSAGRILMDIRRFRPDLIVAHETLVPLPALVTFACRLIAPLRLIVHDPDPHAGADASISRLKRSLRWMLRKVATGYVVHGLYCRKALLKSVSPKKPVICINHGTLLEPEKFRSPLPGNILFFGRLEQYKGLPTLYAVADLLAEKLEGFRLTVVGHGSEAASVRAFAATRSFVEFNEGYASPEDVISAMQDAVVVLLPYDEATQSGVLAAAMANGRPVVTAAVGAIVEVIDGQNGIAVPPADVAAFAGALEKILSDPLEWERLSQGAMRTAGSSMNWKTIGRAIVGPPEVRA
jgi:O-antigen/teichoic acid export membrane protein/glycosyltransferase involved in cell wall biosynthesis